jgi:murein DD-endopeptidase MepM/ murein hydrolase activator NlpD
MGSFVELSHRSRWPRLSALALMTAAVAGCSGETTRFGENPYSSPYSASKDTTGSVARAPSGKVESQPLPQTQAYPQAQPLPPPSPPAVQRPATVSSGGSSGGSAGMGSYQPHAEPVSYAPPSDITGSVATPPKPAPVAAPAPSKWDWNGGTAIIVGPGETVQTLSNKYGVPISAIMEANNLSGLTLKPGQRVVIPRLNGAAGAATASQPPRPAAPAIVSGGQPASAPVAAAAPKGVHVHVVAPGETLMALSRRYHKPVGAIATANKIQPYAQVKVGDRIVIPGVTPQSAKALPPASTPVQPPAAAPPKVAAVEPPQTARVATPEPPAAPETTVAEPTGGAPSFRWPVRGRVITAFGAKTDGQQNDGVNLAVPVGTAIRSAEDGVVAYAGNELKGYGNLILVRHTDGFVTAYAHASELMVKRGDKVRRGQVIAKSGQTGNVSAPQLHFEIRKGSTPVDPMQHLPGA